MRKNERDWFHCYKTTITGQSDVQTSLKTRSITGRITRHAIKWHRYQFSRNLGGFVRLRHNHRFYIHGRTGSIKPLLVIIGVAVFITYVQNIALQLGPGLMYYTPLGRWVNRHCLTGTAEKRRDLSTKMTILIPKASPFQRGAGFSVFLIHKKCGGNLEKHISAHPKNERSLY